MILRFLLVCGAPVWGISAVELMNDEVEERFSQRTEERRFLK